MRTTNPRNDPGFIRSKQQYPGEGEAFAQPPMILANCRSCNRQPHTFIGGSRGQNMVIKCTTPNCLRPATTEMDPEAAVKQWNACQWS